MQRYFIKVIILKKINLNDDEKSTISPYTKKNESKL